MHRVSFSLSLSVCTSYWYNWNSSSRVFLLYIFFISLSVFLSRFSFIFIFCPYILCVVHRCVDYYVVFFPFCWCIRVFGIPCLVSATLILQFDSLVPSRLRPSNDRRVSFKTQIFFPISLTGRPFSSRQSHSKVCTWTPLVCLPSLHIFFYSLLFLLFAFFV